MVRIFSFFSERWNVPFYKATMKRQIMNIFIRAKVRIFSFFGERWNVSFHEAINNEHFYSCNGKNIFIFRWKMGRFISWSDKWTFLFVQWEEYLFSIFDEKWNVPFHEATNNEHFYSRNGKNIFIFRWKIKRFISRSDNEATNNECYYSCNGKNIFIFRWKMECFISRRDNKGTTAIHHLYTI
jgi:hypothetical protein